ncbi:MAG TPA: hypothetical protein VMG11_14430 [Steroidobacteraceae bacterium]|nr:hypothetical protein [Steroidobacteraceae bacterium]
MEVASIRDQIARCVEFRGYGPTTLAVTGILAFVVASAQSAFPTERAHAIPVYIGLWTGTAAVALTLIIIETIVRSRRIHSGLAVPMLHSALEQFLPSLVAGALLTLVLVTCAPLTLWMLPGLWQLLFSQGVFASRRFLPRPIFWVGVWYLATGLACLVLGQGDRALSPWEMGIPFGLGQLLVAAVLRFGYRDADAWA